MPKDEFSLETKLEVGDVISGNNTNISQEKIDGDKVGRDKIIIYNQLDSVCKEIVDFSERILSSMAQQIKEKESKILELVREGGFHEAELSRLKTEKEKLEKQVPEFKDRLDSLNRLMKRAKAYKEVRTWLTSQISTGISQKIGKEALDKFSQRHYSTEEVGSFYGTLHEYLIWIVESVDEGGPINKERPKPTLAIEVYGEAFKCLKRKADADMSNQEVKELFEFVDYLLNYLNKLSVSQDTPPNA